MPSLSADRGGRHREVKLQGRDHPRQARDDTDPARWGRCRRRSATTGEQCESRNQHESYRVSSRDLLSCMPCGAPMIQARFRKSSPYRGSQLHSLASCSGQTPWFRENVQQTRHLRSRRSESAGAVLDGNQLMEVAFERPSEITTLAEKTTSRTQRAPGPRNVEPRQPRCHNRNNISHNTRRLSQVASLGCLGRLSNTLVPRDALFN